VALREAWTSEASDFTPWLAQEDNIRLLGEIIGIDLEVEAQEKGVGPFRADILCKDATTDKWVLIENQLERTDHTHLGQLITYAAGLDAVTIVWVAERFTDEHRAALDWLNQRTDERINFFALEVELWRIGDSSPAPKFNVVCKPNEWTRIVGESARNTEKNQLRHDYWSAFLKEPGLKIVFTAPLNPTRQGHINLPTPWKNFRLTVYLNRTGKRIGPYLTCTGENASEDFQELRSNKVQIEKVLGAELTWEAGEENEKACVVWRLQKNDPEQQNDWPRQHRLLATKTVEFYNAFDPFIRKLEGR
jgi:hypothetical protein